MKYFLQRLIEMDIVHLLIEINLLFMHFNETNIYPYIHQMCETYLYVTYMA